MGDLKLISGAALWDWGNNEPTSLAVRFANNHSDYGEPQWLCLSNLIDLYTGIGEQNTFNEDLIDYLHNYGIKCLIWLHSMWTNFSQATCQRQIDSQMGWGANIDCIHFDEAYEGGGASDIQYYQDLHDYVHDTYGPDYYFSLNCAGRDCSDNFAAVPDFMCMEQHYYQFSKVGGRGTTDMYTHDPDDPLLDKYPDKFWACTADWYVWDGCFYYNGGSGGGGYAGNWCYSTMIRDFIGYGTYNTDYYPYASGMNATQYEQFWIDLTNEAWNNGIYSMCPVFEPDIDGGNPYNNTPILQRWAAPVPPQTEGTMHPGGSMVGYVLPEWWEDYLSKITGGFVSDTDTYFEPAKRNADPSTIGWGALQSGRLWFNSGINKLRYWNGSLVKTII